MYSIVPSLGHMQRLASKPLTRHISSSCRHLSSRAISQNVCAKGFFSACIYGPVVTVNPTVTVAWVAPELSVPVAVTEYDPTGVLTWGGGGGGGGVEDPPHAQQPKINRLINARAA